MQADFSRLFDRVDACRLPRPRKGPTDAAPKDSSVTCYGEWDESSAGGCLNNPSWRRNPQLLLDVEADPNGRPDSRVVLTLTQPSLYGAEREYLSVGLVLLRGSGRRRFLVSPHHSPEVGNRASCNL